MHKEQLQFLLAEVADYEAIAEIYNEHILARKSTMDQVLKKAADIQRWIEQFNDRERLFVLKREGQTIGWGIIKRYSNREGYRFACETAIYLKGEERRKGYGSYMKKEILKHCKALGYHHLVAKIFAINKGSIEYNRRLGYEIVGVQKQIGVVNGKWMDIVIMQYVFK